MFAPSQNAYLRTSVLRDLNQEPLLKLHRAAEHMQIQRDSHGGQGSPAAAVREEARQEPAGTEEWYKTRFLELSQASAEHAENVRHFREEIGNCKRSKRGLTPFQTGMQHAWLSSRKPKRNTRETPKDHR
ncbi:hypothetical protein Y1Q_0006573 [Alligator mississippiensis]|uniref:Uncharacterized protein n=1 Tax=Alligator mississippiensis TaxID=8496 RepID=A0A151NTQ8_ALLMI|nr:hypothetical protein Y1Q_0006573 [Alligator mississippiensis]